MTDHAPDPYVKSRNPREVLRQGSLFDLIGDALFKAGDQLQGEPWPWLPRTGSQKDRLLRLLVVTPQGMTGRQLGDALGVKTAYVARDMANLAEAGLVENLRPGANRAHYVATRRAQSLLGVQDKAAA